MIAILSLQVAIALGALVFMAYAMMFTLILLVGIVAALFALLYFGIQQAAQGNNALLIVAVLVWKIFLLVALAVFRNSRPTKSSDR